MDTQLPQRRSSDAEKPYRKFRPYIISLALIIAVIILLPYGIRYGIIQALMHSGAEQAHIDDIDFNPFTGRLSVHNLSVKEGGTSPLNISMLEVRFSWFPLFRKRIYLKELTIDRGSLSISQRSDSQLSIGGIMLPEQSEEGARGPSTWGIGTGHAEIKASTVTFNGPDLTAHLAVGSFNLRNAKSWAPELESTLEFSGKLNDGNVHISAALRPFSDAVEVKGEASVKALSIPPFSRVLIPGNRLSVERGSAGWTGHFSFRRSSGEIRYTLNGDAGLENLAVLIPEENLLLVALRKLNLHLIKIDGTGHIGAATLEADALEVARPVNETPLDKETALPLFEAESFVVSDISVVNLNDISIQSIDMKSANALLSRAPDGTWPTLYASYKALTGADEKAKPVKNDRQPVRITVDGIHIKENSSIVFMDETVDPPYRTTLLLNKADIGNIDSARPEEKSLLGFEGKIGEYSTYQFSGDFQPFAEKITMNISGSIHELSLPPLSSYAVKTLGYNVTSGHLDADIQLNVRSGKIEGNNALVLKKLKLDPKDANKIMQLISDLTISLESALSLLRDKDGTIRFKLPVSGDISDPGIDTSDIMNRALVGAMKKAAFSYLKHVIQPYGALITVIEIAGKAAMKIRLDPVEFQPGLTTLGPKAQEYLNVVTKLMQERPGIQVSICGKAAQSDIRLLNEKAVEELTVKTPAGQPAPKEGGPATAQEKEISPPEAVTEEQILALAGERALNIKKYLSDERGIGSGRLFICNPEIDEDEKAAPRADLLI